jgi:hypothetical protein
MRAPTGTLLGQYTYQPHHKKRVDTRSKTDHVVTDDDHDDAVDRVDGQERYNLRTCMCTLPIQRLTLAT